MRRSLFAEPQTKGKDNRMKSTKRIRVAAAIICGVIVLLTILVGRIGSVPIGWRLKSQTCYVFVALAVSLIIARSGFEGVPFKSGIPNSWGRMAIALAGISIIGAWLLWYRVMGLRTFGEGVFVVWGALFWTIPFIASVGGVVGVLSAGKRKPKVQPVSPELVNSSDESSLKEIWTPFAALVLMVVCCVFNLLTVYFHQARMQRFGELTKLLDTYATEHKHFPASLSELPGYVASDEGIVLMSPNVSLRETVTISRRSHGFTLGQASCSRGVLFLKDVTMGDRFAYTADQQTVTFFSDDDFDELEQAGATKQ
jgi:hypothetical protein